MRAAFYVLFASAAAAEEVLGSFIFARHGDRLQKPTVFLTPIGAAEEVESGSFWRKRYFDELPIEGLNQTYDPTQFLIQVPTSDVLFKSMMSFTQGFYPPLDGNDINDVEGASLGNGSSQEMPLEGYQYVMLDSIDDESTNYWRIKGDEQCPTYTAASKAYLKSDEFNSLNKSTYDFYQSLSNYTKGEIPPHKLNYGNAYNVYDHFLTQYVHNKTLADDFPSDLLQRVQALSDVYSRNLNDNDKNSTTQIGAQTLLGVVTEFLENARNTSDPLRVQVMGGSYDQFYQLFGLLDLYKQDEALFTGIVDYASVVVFELVRQDGQSEDYVRVGVRNGTTVSRDSADLKFWPVLDFASNLTSADQFLNATKKLSITEFTDWCSGCGAQTAACEAEALKKQVADSKHDGGLSLVDAGGIGAGVTTGVFLILGALGAATWAVLRRRRNKMVVDHSSDTTSSSTGTETKSMV